MWIDIYSEAVSSTQSWFLVGMSACSSPFWRWGWVKEISHDFRVQILLSAWEVRCLSVFMATVWCMDLNKRESLDMARRFSSGFQPSLVIMVETLLVLLESLQTNLAALRCTASNLFLWSCLYGSPHRGAVFQFRTHQGFVCCFLHFLGTAVQVSA